MKKQALFVLMLSSLILSACNNPVTSSSESSVSGTSNAQPTSSQSVESSKESSQSAQSTKSSQSSQSSKSSQSSSKSSSSSSASSLSGEPSGVALKLTAPENDIHTDLQYSYLKDPDWRNIKAYIPTTGADGGNKGDKSAPKALSFKFEDVADAGTYYIQISKDNTFANAEVRTSTKKSYDFINAEVGTKYYYRAAVSQDALASATVKEYQVADTAPRNLKVGGMINFRDQGGWKSSLVPNGVIKQGLYYRCAQFNNITAEGKKVIKDLGIKVDIDMRDRPPSTSPINTSDWPVQIIDAHVASGTENVRWEGSNGIAATYKKIFEAIAQADEKPIALHCTHGADRTGIMSFFLMGLLGASEADIGRDYVLTRFAGERAVPPTGSSSEIAKWFTKTNALAGATFADKTYKHLKDDFGISAITLETIREKFVPGYTKPPIS